MVNEDTREFIDGIIEYLDGLIYDAHLNNNMKEDANGKTYWDGQISVAEELQVLLREIK